MKYNSEELNNAVIAAQNGKLSPYFTIEIENAFMHITEITPGYVLLRGIYDPTLAVKVHRKTDVTKYVRRYNSVVGNLSFLLETLVFKNAIDSDTIKSVYCKPFSRGYTEYTTFISNIDINTLPMLVLPKIVRIAKQRLRRLNITAYC